MSKYTVWHDGHNTFPPRETDSDQSIWVMSDDGQPVFYDYTKEQWLGRINDSEPLYRWRFIQARDLKVF